jgi:DNA processing protein
VTTTREATRAEAETLVTISLVRLGTDTRLARLFWELRRSNAFGGSIDGLDLANRLGEVLGLSNDEWDQCLGRAGPRARKAMREAEDLGLTLLHAFDSGYPAPLAEIVDPPIALWVAGDPSVLGGPAVAIVGSRRATPAGLAVARRLSSELAAAGVTVTSGLARGIDGAAHRGALDATGRTIAVLGNGPDIAYPSEHRGLMADVARAGAVVTEFPPGAPPYASHFPLRNRIISGLSKAVVVVEASDRSGSLITARAALEQGREVLAVPGSVASGCSRGCHALIKDGARLVETVEDILEELSWSAPRHVQAQHSKHLVIKGLERFMAPGDPVSVDELAIRSGRPAAQWLADLALLELEGAVVRTAGGSFMRVDAPATYIDTQGGGERKGTGIAHGKGTRHRRVAGEGEDD